MTDVPNTQEVTEAAAAPVVTQNGVKRPVDGADKVLFDLFDAVSSANNTATTLNTAMNHEIAASLELHLPEGVKDPNKYIRNVYLKWVQFHGVYDIVKFDADESLAATNKAVMDATIALDNAKEALKVAKSNLAAATKYSEKAEVIADSLRMKSEGRAAKSQERKIEAQKRKVQNLAEQLRAAGIDPLSVLQA